MKRLVLLILIVLSSSKIYSLTWDYYTKMTKTVSGVPQSISTGAVDATYKNGYIWVCGSGNTFNGNSDRSLYAVPIDLSSETIDRTNRLPYPGQKHTQLFSYGNYLYWFGGAQHRVVGSKRYPYLYGAVISGSSVGSFFKIADLPYYSTHPYIQYSIAQNEDNNAYYIIGGQVWGNSFYADSTNIFLHNGKLYYEFLGSDRDEWISGEIKAHETINYGVLDKSSGDFIDYARTLIVPGGGLFAYDGIAFSAVSNGIIFIASHSYDFNNLNGEGYSIWKTDFSGNTLTYFDYPCSTGTSSKIASAITYNNNVYFCGTYNNDNIVGKIDSNGVQQWVTKTGYAGSYGLLKIIQNNNYLYTCGQQGIHTAYIAKLDINGNTLVTDTYSHSIDVPIYQDITATSVDLYTILNSGNTVSVIAYDANLNFKWSYTIPGWSYSSGVALKDSSTINVFGGDLIAQSVLLQIDSSGNCLNTFILPYGSYKKIISDGFNFYGIESGENVVKTDADGNSIWTRRFRGENPSNNISYIKVSGAVIVDSWTTTVPFRVYDAYSTIYDGYLYVFGGNYREDGSTTTSWAAPINLNGTLGEWSSISPMFYQASKGDITRINNKIFIVSGIDPTGANHVHEGTLLSGIVTWDTFTTNFPFTQKYTSLINDSCSVYSIGGWSGIWGENPVDSIYKSSIFTPTITPTLTNTLVITLTPTITPTVTLTSSFTSTITPTFTVTPTPIQIWYRTSMSVYQDSVLMSDVTGSYIVDLSDYWTWFQDGYSVFCSRDIVQDNTYLVVEKSNTSSCFIIHIKDRSTLTNIDLSSNTCTVYFTVIKTP